MNSTTLYSDCVIGMDLNNWKGIFADKIKFTVLVGYLHKNVIVDFIFMAATATIDFEETVADACLTVVGGSKNVCE